MPRHKLRPISDKLQGFVDAYRALSPEEKFIALCQMGFTQHRAEEAIVLHMRRAAKDAMAAFEERREQERLRHRKAAPVIRLNGDPGEGDDLVVKDDEEPEA